MTFSRRVGGTAPSHLWLGGLCLLAIMAVVLPGCTGGSAVNQPSAPVDQSPLTDMAPSEFGSVLSVDEDARTIAVKFVEFFGDEEANRAAQEDGVIGPGEQLPNPFYIRDLSTEGTLTIAADVRVTLLMIDSSGSPQPVQASLSEFAEAFNSEGFGGGQWYGSTSSIYHLKIREGSVTRIKEIYTP